MLDSESGEGLSGVSVFVAETTIGAATDGRGQFSIQTGDLEGYMTLVASMVGYEPASQVVNVSGSKSGLVFRLEPAVYDLDAASVEAEVDRAWRRMYSRIERELLGNSRAGRSAEILNPYVLDLETADRQIHASADEVLQIRNPHLGYEVRFVLEDFALHTRNDELRYSGLPHFIDLLETDPSSRRKWIENRKRAYSGSLRHFLVALVEDRLAEEGFRMVRREDINLVRNAIEAVQNALQPTILMNAVQDDGGRSCVQIVDNGMGIVEESLDNVFVPFFTTKKDGSGIGLTLSREIMRQHGGTISVSSTPGERTTFTLRF